MKVIKKYFQLIPGKNYRIKVLRKLINLNKFDKNKIIKLNQVLIASSIYFIVTN